MVLVDTSVWVDFFKDRSTPKVEALGQLISDSISLVSTGIVLQEVLSGVKIQSERRAIRRSFSGLIMVMPTVTTHVEAADLFDGCQKKGETIRKSVDCLIAALCIEHGLPILHDDKDFDRISKFFPLKIQPGI